MRDEPNAHDKGHKHQLSLETMEVRCWLKTAGRWPWKLASAKECVTTHLPKPSSTKMNCAKAGSRCMAVCGSKGPVGSRVRTEVSMPRRVGWRVGELGRLDVSLTGAAFNADLGGSSKCSGENLEP
jgi:hypothetical protein